MTISLSNRLPCDAKAYLPTVASAGNGCLFHLLQKHSTCVIKHEHDHQPEHNYQSSGSGQIRSLIMHSHGKRAPLDYRLELVLREAQPSRTEQALPYIISFD